MVVTKISSLLMSNGSKRWKLYTAPYRQVMRFKINLHRNVLDGRHPATSQDTWMCLRPLELQSFVLHAGNGTTSFRIAGPERQSFWVPRSCVWASEDRPLLNSWSFQFVLVTRIRRQRIRSPRQDYQKHNVIHSLESLSSLTIRLNHLANTMPSLTQQKVLIIQECKP